MKTLKLMDYQREGVRFLLDRPADLNCKPHRLLADEQGLGKTAQAIGALIEIRSGSTLIVCPAQVKYHWARNLVDWGFADFMDVQVIRKKSDWIDPTKKHLIVNYELLLSKKLQEQLRLRHYDALVVDEAHKLKSLTSQRSNILLGKDPLAAHAYWKFLLSGTILPNRPMELYPILRTLAPEVIYPHISKKDYGKYFCRAFERGGEWVDSGSSNEEELRERLKPFMLRREVKDVYTELPPLTTNIIDLDVQIPKHPEIINNPELPQGLTIEDYEGWILTPTLRRLTAECKVPHALPYIREYMEGTDKLTLFAYHKNVIDTLAEELAEFNPVVLRGGSNPEKKQQLIDEFGSNPDRRIFIGQLLASGEGIDGLQKVCNRVMFVEIDWSAGAMEQAVSRLHRIGQDHPVFATYLVANDSLETIISDVLERKRNVIRRIIQPEERITSMTIEAKLDRIIELLESSTGAPSNVAEATEKPKKSAAAAPKKAAGLSETAEKEFRAAVNKSMQAISKASDKDTAITTVQGILKKYKAKDLNDFIKNHIDEMDNLLADLVAAEESAAAAPAEADDDFDV